MKYNLYLFGRVYRHKTISEILELIEPYRERLDNEYYRRSYGVECEIKHIKTTVSRIAFYNFVGNVIVSLNRID